MKKIFALLNQPFPVHVLINYRLPISFALSVFITLFVLFVDPVKDLMFPDGKKIWIISGYGAICFVVVCFETFTLPVLMKERLKEGNWKIYMQILSDLITIAFGTIAILAYNYAWNITKFNLFSFVFTLVGIITTTFIPISIAALLVYNYHLNKNLSVARDLQQALLNENKKWNYSGEQSKIILTDALGKEILNLSPEEIVLIRSADNYVEVFWKTQDKVQRTLLRQTMKFVEDKLTPYNFFFRNHRTSIVNLKSIKTISGNSLGCKLLLEGLDEEIPVSRQNRDKLTKLLSSNNPVNESQ